MSETRDDLEYLPVLVSLPKITVFEYLVGCWKRLNTGRALLMKKVILTIIPPDSQLKQVTTGV